MFYLSKMWQQNTLFCRYIVIGYHDLCICMEYANDLRANLLIRICIEYNIPLVDMNTLVDKWEEEII